MDFLHLILASFGVFWLGLALRPHDRSVWIAENILTVTSIIVVLATYERWPLSNLSYSLLIAFLVLHSIGAHFTYVRVPYEEVMRLLFGLEVKRSFGWVRNHYDRLVHFAYGVLLAWPFFELLERYAQPLPGWSQFFSVVIIMATSMLFEVFEWWASALLSKGAGAAYVGAQGDEWDAQKDMALATLGSILTMTVAAFATG